MANDFAGFNLYIQQGSGNFTNAVGYPSLPTIPYDTHTRTNITLTFPTSANPQNNNLYYVGVTAYGTNELAPGGKIETKVVAIPVVPREEPTGSTGFTITGTTTVAAANGVIQSYGVQSNFNAITVFTNNIPLTRSADYLQGGLYIASNGTTLYKLWIDLNGNLTSASHTQGNVCSTI